jgi:hypothetical protein
VGPSVVTLAEHQQIAGLNAACWVPVCGNEPATMAAATTARVGIPIAHCQNDWPSFDLGLSVVPRRDHEPANQTGDHRTWGHGADAAWGRGADAVVFLTPAPAMAQIALSGTTSPPSERYERMSGGSPLARLSLERQGEESVDG